MVLRRECVCEYDDIKSIKSAEARYEIFVISLAAKITEAQRAEENLTPCCGCKV